jgi:hypothetical protein
MTKMRLRVNLARKTLLLLQNVDLAWLVNDLTMHLRLLPSMLQLHRASWWQQFFAGGLMLVTPSIV